MRYLSICSGIEAASVAWHSLGWRAVAYAEVDAFPSAVLAHHYPLVPNWGDVTRFKEWPDADVDVLVGGTPCQSFSVAGLRKGLDDPRGNLALTYLAIAERYRPEWLVWENVPGVLSSSGGRDFGAFLGGLAELGYGFAYRVLDAQYFGLAQRRKRVFVVGNSRDWRRAAAVLFERASLRWDSAPSREAGQRPAPTISARTKGGGGLGTDFACDGGLIPERARALTASNQRNDAETETLICATLEASGESFTGQFAEAGGVVVHSLRADGFDASEDGSGRGTPITLAIRGRGDSSDLECRTDGTANALLTPNGGRGGIGCGAVAFDARQSDVIQYGVKTGPLDTCGFTTGIAYGLRSDASRDGSAKTPSADAEGRVRLRDPGFNAYRETAPTIDSGQPHSVATAMQVRRPTPRECERLQGFPDDYTLIRYRGKPAADGPRYKALGNSMAVPVMRWIGRRIDMVAAIPQEVAA